VLVFCVSAISIFAKQTKIESTISNPTENNLFKITDVVEIKSEGYFNLFEVQGSSQVFLARSARSFMTNSVDNKNAGPVFYFACYVACRAGTDWSIETCRAICSLANPN
jgi:hypothetical protein